MSAIFVHRLLLVDIVAVVGDGCGGDGDGDGEGDMVVVVVTLLFTMVATCLYTWWKN